MKALLVGNTRRWMRWGLAAMLLSGLIGARPAMAAIPVVEGYGFGLVFSADHEWDGTLVVDSQDAAGNFQGRLGWLPESEEFPVTGVISEPRTGYYRISFTARDVLWRTTFEGVLLKDSSSRFFMAGSYTNTYWQIRPGQKPRLVSQGPLPFCAIGEEVIP